MAKHMQKRQVVIARVLVQHLCRYGEDSLSTEASMNAFLRKSKFWRGKSLKERRKHLKKFLDKYSEDIKLKVQIVLRKNRNSFEHGTQEERAISNEASSKYPPGCDQHTDYLNACKGELYCLCRSEWKGEPMIQCQCCDQWFHSRCVLEPTYVKGDWEKVPLVCNSTVVAIHFNNFQQGSFVTLPSNAILNQSTKFMKDASTTTEDLSEFVGTAEIQSEIAGCDYSARGTIKSEKQDRLPSD